MYLLISMKKFKFDFQPLQPHLDFVFFLFFFSLTPPSSLFLLVLLAEDAEGHGAAHLRPVTARAGPCNHGLKVIEPGQVVDAGPLHTLHRFLSVSEHQPTQRKKERKKEKTKTKNNRQKFFPLVRLVFFNLIVCQFVSFIFLF
jgi:hypothetical protein